MNSHAGAFFVGTAIMGAIRGRACSVCRKSMHHRRKFVSFADFRARRTALLSKQHAKADIVVAAAPVAAPLAGSNGGGTGAIPCILDTDIGDDIDDTWALAMLLNSPELDLRYVLTSGAGHHQARARIVAKMLATAGRADVRIGMGVEATARCPLRQEAWASDVDLSLHPGGCDEDGVGGLLNAVREAADAGSVAGTRSTVQLIVIGPCHNIHEALRRDPSFARQAHFIGMHGSIRVGYSSMPSPVAEFNVKNNIEACRAVFQANFASKSIAPLDTCGVVHLSGDAYQAVVDAAKSSDVMDETGHLARAVLENVSIWEPLFLATHPHFADLYSRSAGRSSVLFDCAAIALALPNARDLMDIERLRIEVDDDGFTREQGAVADSVASTQAAGVLDVAVGWRNYAAFERLLVQRISGRLARA